MNQNFRTEQEVFWAGDFGADYSARNVDPHLLASNTALFARVLSSVDRVSSVIEFGANIGLNLIAIRSLLPHVSLRAIEINPHAAAQLKQTIGPENVVEGSILDAATDQTADLVLVKGVLIHINPDVLEAVYDKLYWSSTKYIMVCEYYNPTPISVAYRGFENKLFKRDFAGEMLNRFSGLKLVDYGFVYRHDLNFPLDDVTWFLLKK